MKKFFIFAALAGALYFSNAAAEEVIFNGSVPRVNEIARGGFSVKIFKDEKSPSNWSISAKQNEIMYIQPVIRDGKNIFIFPESVLEARNANLPIMDRWDCMAENIGDFQIIKKKFNEFPAKHGASIAKSVLFGKETLKLDNGSIELELCPAVNGAIVRFVDKLMDANWFYMNNSTFGSADANTFQGAGFVELINAYGGVIGNSFEPFEIVENKKSCAVKTRAFSREYPDAKLERIVKLENNSTLLSIRSTLSSTQNAGKPFRLKHRPETRIGGDVSGGDCFYIPENDEFKEISIKAGEQYVRGNCLAAVDRQKGTLLAVVYETNDLETIYLWVDKEKQNIEAWTIERPLQSPLSLNVVYYLIRGMDKVNALNKNAVLSMTTDKPLHVSNEKIKLNVAVGLPRQYKEILLNVSLIGTNGKKALEVKEKIPDVLPGIAVHRNFELALTGLKEREYTAKVEALRNGSQLISAHKKIKVLEAQVLEKYNKALGDFDGALENIKKKWVAEKDPAQKNILMKKFSGMVKIRSAFAERLKNGSFENLDDIYRKITEKNGDE